MPETDATFTCWQAADRDSPAGAAIDVTFSFEATDESNARLKALLQMDGLDGNDDTAVTAKTGLPITRARRWCKFFERMGLMYRDGNITRLTGLGRVMADIGERSKLAFREKVAVAALRVLRKYQLKNPADERDGRYPNASALSKTDPPVLSKSDPAILT